MSSGQEGAQVIRYWWERAQESLASAEREWEAGAHHVAINRLYYTAFYAVSAALFERGLYYKKHAAVRAAFHREFIRTGLLDTKWGKLYDMLFEDRQEGDYIALTLFDREHVASRLTACSQFLEQIQALIPSLSQA